MRTATAILSLALLMAACAHRPARQVGPLTVEEQEEACKALGGYGAWRLEGQPGGGFKSVFDHCVPVAGLS